VEQQVEGIVNGTIATAEAGCGGFGYDPLFIPEGHEVTFAEMSADEKNAISHRGRAVAELVKLLRNG
jgi:XTP/dITP diphosphohydrolase